MNDKASGILQRVKTAPGLIPIYRHSSTGAFECDEHECGAIIHVATLVDCFVEQCGLGVFEARDVLRTIGLTYEMIKASADAAKSALKKHEVDRPRRDAIARITNAFEPVIKVVAKNRRMCEPDVGVVDRWLSLFFPEHHKFNFTDEELQAAIGVELSDIAYLNGAMIVAGNDRKIREKRESEEKQKRERNLKKKSVMLYSDIGYKLLESWGLEGSDVAAVIKASTVDKHSLSVQCAILEKLCDIANSIKNLPSKLAKASRAADLEIARVQRDAEKYRAKQVEAQARIAEASRPITLSLVTSSPEEIADEYDDGRVLRVF